MKIVDIIAFILLVVGGLNWGLVGLFDFNLVSFVFSHLPIVARVIYVVVGAAAVYSIVRWKACEQCCK